MSNQTAESSPLPENRRPLPVTAIILTLNERANIEECVACLSRVGDVVLVDSMSTDGTIEAAKKVRPDIRVYEHPFKDFGDQRNWALDTTEPRYPWVLFIDADEFCSPELLDEIDRFVAQPGDFVGGYIAGRNYFLGRWLKHSMMFPSYQLRLLKLGHVRYQKYGHGQREVSEGPFRYFEQNWRHESFSKGVSEWIARHNRYSTAEVELCVDLQRQPLSWRQLVFGEMRERRRTLKQISTKMPLRPIFTFIYLYVIRGGFLDGYPGFLYCWMMMAHHIHIEAKLAEYAQAKNNDFKHS